MVQLCLSVERLYSVQIDAGETHLYSMYWVEVEVKHIAIRLTVLEQLYIHTLVHRSNILPFLHFLFSLIRFKCICMPCSANIITFLFKFGYVMFSSIGQRFCELLSLLDHRASGVNYLQHLLWNNWADCNLSRPDSESSLRC